MTFRSLLGFSKKGLAERLNIPPRLLGRYESSKEKPPWPVVFATVMLGERPLYVVHEMRYALLVLRPGPDNDFDPHEEYREERELRAASRNLFPSEKTKQISDEVCLLAQAPAGRQEPSPEEAEAWAIERHEAMEIWDALKDLPPWEWRSHPYLHPWRLTSWAECERLCAESLRLIQRLIGDGVESWDPRLRDAEDLAWLALRSACLCRTTAPWKPRLAEYAWAHIGATRGLLGDFSGAEEAFFHAGQHLMQNHRLSWGPLEGGTPLFLQAQIRFRQRDDKAALALLRHAAEGLGPGHEAALLEAEIHLRGGRPAQAVPPLEGFLASAEPGSSDRRLTRRAVRLLAEGVAGLLAAGHGTEVESLLDQRAEALVEAAGLSAGARAQLRLLFRLAREGRLEAARAAQMVEELRGLLTPPAKQRSRSIESYPLLPDIPL